MSQNFEVFSHNPHCQKCGQQMYLSTHILPIYKEKKEVSCWRCHCGYAMFSETQLKDIDTINKLQQRAIN